MPNKEKPDAIAKMEKPGQPYSSVVQIGDHFHFPGIVAIDADKKPDGTSEEQIDQVFHNMLIALNACGLKFDDVYNANIRFAGTMEHYDYFNARWMENFEDCEVLPVRDAMAVVALPFGCAVEVKFDAVKQKEILNQMQ